MVTIIATFIRALKYNTSYMQLNVRFIAEVQFEIQVSVHI